MCEAGESFVYVVHVEVVSVDAGCDLCDARLADVPVVVADSWLQAHRAPVLLAMNSLLNGRPSRWVRTRRTA